MIAQLRQRLARALFDSSETDPARRRTGQILVALVVVAFVWIAWPFVPVLFSAIGTGIIDLISGISNAISPPPPPTAIPTASPSPLPR